MNKRLLFHPVFNLQPWNTTEMFHIACHDNEVFFKCCCSNERIHIANLLSLALQQPAYLAILAKGFYAISGPCRNSLAISIGLFSPPQSLWKRASAASNMASESSFHVGRLLVYSCQDFFASSSSRFTCSDICSTNHRRSWRSSVFSIVSKASIGILPIVFILKHVYFIAAKLRIKSE